MVIMNVWFKSSELDVLIKVFDEYYEMWLVVGEFDFIILSKIVKCVDELWVVIMLNNEWL